MSESNDSFVRGVYVGIASTTVLIHVWLALQLAPLQVTYAEFRADHLPTLTTIAISPYWLWGLPAIGALAVTALVSRRPQSKLVYAIVAGALMLLAIATWRWSQAPLRDLASTLR
jgi:hypothetical protein